MAEQEKGVAVVVPVHAPGRMSTLREIHSTGTVVLVQEGNLLVQRTSSSQPWETVAVYAHGKWMNATVL